MMRWTANQQKAIDVRGHNVIVSAGAGSGKTAVLTERVFELLKEGTALDEILVLTFTNAAASEMRGRIRKKLSASENLKDLASRIDASDICTFDAFALSLVKKYHYVLGLGNHVSIVDENLIKIKKRKIIDELFEERYEANDPRFVAMIHKYALRSDDDLKDFVLRIDAMANLKIDKSDYLTQYTKLFFDEQKIRGDLDLFRKNILETAKNIQKGALAYENPKMGDLVYHAFDAMLSAGDYDTFQQALADFKFPRANRLSEQDAILHESLKNGCEKFPSYAAIGNATEVIKRYYATKDSLEVFLDMVTTMDERLDAFKKTYEAFTFSDIAKMALFLVKNTSIGKTLQKKLKHILIDEYQDTSDLQEEFVRAIGNQNVYMVGDIKQSIYRFRNANSDIFAQKYLTYQKKMGGEAIDLNENFRSRREVIEDINALFSELMSLPLGGAAYTESHLIEYGNHDYEALGTWPSNHHMDVLLYEKNENEDKTLVEARLVAEDILRKVKEGYLVFDKDEKKLHPAEFGDFAILIDRKTKFDLYQKEFSRFGIPLSVEKDAVLSDSDVILTFQSLVRLLDCTIGRRYDEIFRHAFFSVARSFLYPLNDQEIMEIDHQKNFEESVIMQTIERVAIEKKSYPLSDMLSALVDHFNIFENLIKIGNVAENRRKIEGLIEVAKSLETIGYGLKEFVEYFDDLASFEIALAVPATNPVGHCVRLMSIHKSKGLEFPIIYYCGISSRFNEAGTASSFLADSTFGIVLPLIDDLEASNVYHYLIKQKERRAELSEQIRLFYVALTRAKEKMIFLFPLQDEEKAPIQSLETTKSFYDFLRYVKADRDFGIPAVSFETTANRDIKKEGELRVIFKTNTLSYHPVHIHRASKVSTSSSNREAMMFGTRIHALLEMTDFQKKDLSFITNPKERAMIQKVMDLPLFRHLEKTKIFKEYQFIDQESSLNGIIDLLLVSEHEILVVDYKLKNLDDEGYRSQLQAYQNYVSKTFKRPTQCYLLSITTGELRRVDLP